MNPEIEEMQIQRLIDAEVIFNEAEMDKYLAAPDVLDLPKEASVPEGYKRCGGCGLVKKFYLFNRNSSVKNNCTGTCKECQKRAANKSYQANKSKRDYKKYYKEHKEAKKAHSRRYYEEHKEELKEKHKQYRTSAKGKKVMKKAHRKRRKLLTKNVGIPYTREMVIERDSTGGEFPICYLCGEPITDGKLHLDHVIPVVLKGKDCFTNIACVHEYCNLTKSKDAHEITTEQVHKIMDLSDAYIEAHPDKFPDIFEPEDEPKSPQK